MFHSPQSVGSRTPWWYRFVRSWRLRMWVETGAWADEPVGYDPHY
jgi:hypothetical protein